jgi:tetratricopeptide (TPR) repeat protein
MRVRLAALVVVALSGAVYLNALHNPFVYDDYRVIQQNRSLLAPQDVGAIVARDLTRPVVNWSYAIDRVVWGPEPFGFHVTSVLLHMVAVWLVFLLASRLAMDRMRRESTAAIDRGPALAALSAAALFGLHPMMTEAVGYISGRAEVLAAVLVLAAFLLARDWMETGRWASLAGAFGAWALGLLSKETAIVFPLLVLYYDRVVRDDPDERRRHLWRLHVPLFAVAAGVGIVRLTVFLSVEYAGGATVHWPFMFAELDVLMRYVGLLIVPSGQTIFHAIPATTGGLARQAIVAAVTLGVILGVLALTSRRARIASLGLFWFVVVPLPQAMLVLLNRGEPMAERRVYLASVGFFIAVGSAIGYVAGRPRAERPVMRVALGTIGMLVLVMLAGRTLLRNVIWSSPVLLWTEATQLAPDHWLPALVLGESLHDAGRHADAVAALKRARDLRPDEPGIYEHLGLCLIEVGDLDEATAAFHKLTELSPRSAEAVNGLATISMARGDLTSARRQFLQVLDLEPRNVEARLGLAFIEEAPGGNPAEALRRCQEVQVIAPETNGLGDCIERNRKRLGP